MTALLAGCERGDAPASRTPARPNRCPGRLHDERHAEAYPSPGVTVTPMIKRRRPLPSGYVFARYPTAWRYQDGRIDRVTQPRADRRVRDEARAQFGRARVRLVLDRASLAVKDGPRARWREQYVGFSATWSGGEGFHGFS